MEILQIKTFSSSTELKETRSLKDTLHNSGKEKELHEFGILELEKSLSLSEIKL